jgi:adenylate cyclase
MGLEIEKKYLIDQHSFYNEAYSADLPTTLIEQGYLQKDDHIAIRVRIKDKVKASLDVKVRITDEVRLEFEYDIPLDDAHQMLEHVYVIRKRRFDLGDHLTVDEFLSDLSGLYLAEKEFGHEEEMEIYEFPSWCTKDVTSDPTYINCNLMDKKYSDGKVVDLC